MIKVGLTGGIGSGKSVVAGMLAERGAVVVDADRVAREVVAPGQPALAELVAQFGPAILAPDGTLARAELAAIVFSDPDARARMDAIMHPRIAARAGQLFAAAREAGAAVAVYDMPLLVELGLADDFDVVVVVVAPLELRVRRLVARGLSATDARARIAVQASDEQRHAVADWVIDNSGDLAATDAQVAALWAYLSTGPTAALGDVVPVS